MVVELKAGKFKPEFASQLRFCVALVEDELRRPQHAPTRGLLLCADKNERYQSCRLSEPAADRSCDSPAGLLLLPISALSPLSRSC